jgi:hypothetical protein
MSAADIYTALDESIVDGAIDLWQAANDKADLNGLLPVLNLFGITASWEITLGDLSQPPTTVLLTGSGNFSQPGATQQDNIYPVAVTLNYSENGDSFDLSFRVSSGKIWTFSGFFLNLPQTSRADVDPGTSGGITWFDSYLIDVVINSPVFAAKTGDTELTLSGFLPEFQDSNISDRLSLLSPWPLRLEGTLTMPADATGFPMMALKAQGNSSNMFSANNQGGVNGPAPISVNGLGAALIIDTLDAELWGIDAYSTLRMFGAFDLGGGLSGEISNLTLSNGKTWSFSVQFDPETASLTQGLISLGNIFGVSLPIPMDFPLLSDFVFSGVDIDFRNSADSNANPALSISGLALTVVSHETWNPPVPFVSFTDVGARWVWGWTVIDDPTTGGKKNIDLVTGSVFASVVFGSDGDDDGGGTPKALPPGPNAPTDSGGGELIALSQSDSPNDVTIDVSLSLPSLYINAAMQEGDYIGIGAAFNQYFGGICPIVPANMNITQLNFFADPIEQVYNGGATIIFGTPDDPQPDQAWKIFSIDNVGITLQALEMQVEAQGGRVGGGITGTFYLEGAGKNSYEDPHITVSAAYPPQNSDANAGWFFAGSLYPGTSIDLTNMVARFIMGDPDYKVPPYIPELAVDALDATFESASGAYTFAGSMSLRWAPTIFGTELMISAAASTTISRADAQAPIIGQLMGFFAINKISIMATMDIGLPEATYLFKVQFNDLWVEAVTAWKGTTPQTRHQVISTQLGGITLGEILEYLVNLAAPTIGYQLDPPWDILNRIDLSRFVLTLDPTDNVVEFVFNAAVNLGVMRVDTVGARYTKGTGEGKVELILTGNFLGLSYPEDKPLSWDVVNDNPPTVAGQGTSLVDLRFIGLGQRITFAEVTPDTVAQSVALLENAMQTPEPGENPLSTPGIVYSDQSQWLIGLDISLMEMIDLSIIFNDPKLYGLSIGLKGEKAGPLAGLKFEILYKKITDNIGMYRIELRVPDAFRTIELGAVSLTLGIIVVEIYTNGNFKIDLGFPYDRDYSRAFTLQAGIYIGRGGFYFGSLNGDTSTRVPNITNGNFAPVIELGVGLAAGVGREISAGLLSGGAYIEIEVIFQGVLAWFNPTSNGAAPANYFWTQGIVAINGKIYGSVDFGVIKAAVTLDVWEQASVTFESCKPLLLDFSCGVLAEASVKILFVKVHFHFSVTLHFSFTIGSASPTPWILDSNQQSDLHSAAAANRLYTTSARQDHRLRGSQLKASHLRRFKSKRLAMDGTQRTSTEPMVWNPAGLVFTSKKTAHLTMLPLFSIKAMPVDWTGVTPTNPTPKYRASFLLYAETGIDTTAKTTAHTASRSAALSAAAQNDEDTSGLAADLLTEGLLLYTLYALQGGPTITSDPVTAGQLALIAEQLMLPQTRDDGFSYDKLRTFFTTNIAFIVTGVPSGAAPEEKSAMVFPIPPCFSWDSAQWGSTDFSTYNMIGPTYQEQINKTLDQYQCAGNRLGSVTSTDESFSQFIFRDFCQMIVKAAIDEAQRQLQNVPIAFDSTATTAITTLIQAANSFTSAEVHPVKEAGDTVASVAQRIGATVEELTFLNDDVKSIIAGTPVGETVTLNIGVDPQTLALDNCTENFAPQALPLGTVTKEAGQSNNSFAAIATLFNVTDVATILAFEPGSGYSTGENPNLLLEESAFSVADARIFIPPVDGGFDQIRAAALFFVRYDNPDLAPAGTVDIPAWYCQSIALMNIAILQGASAAGTIPQSVEIKPGTLLDIPTKYQDQTRNLVNYRTVPGDTLYRIGTMLALAQDSSSFNLPPLWESFKNGVTASGSNFIIPAWVIDPKTNNTGVVIEHGEDVASLARRLVIDATFDGVSAPSKWQWHYDWPAIDQWIGTAQILAPQAVVTVPGATTSDVEIFSFQSLSETYGLAITDAATRLMDVTGLYPDGTSLTVKQIPVQTVENIVAGILTSTAFAGVVNQASRMMMAGLNLPDPVTDGNGNVVAAPDDPLPLYDLTGQQQKVAVGDIATDIALNLTVSSAEEWITFSDSYTVSASDTLAGLLSTHANLRSLNPGFASDKALKPGMVVATGTSPSGTLTFDFSNADVTADLATGLSIAPFPGTSPAPSSMTLKGNSPRTYGFEQRIVLQSPIALKIPNNGAISGNPSLWPFPQSFVEKAIAETSTAYEIYSTLLGTSQDSDASPVNAVTFGTYIPFRIHKVDDSANRFALLGVDTDQKALLLELKAWLEADPETAKTQAVLAIPPAPNAANDEGVVILDPARGSTYLIKTNLSTESQPPAQMVASMKMSVEESASNYYADFETDFGDFLQLLWEGSVVGGTGYYFGSGTALPGSAFDERGIATLNLLVIPGSQQSPSPESGRTLLKFNTCLLVGTGLDASINTLYAQSGDNTDLTTLSLVPAGSAGFTLLVDRKLTANPPISADERNLAERYNLLAFGASKTNDSPYEIDEVWTPVLPTPDDGTLRSRWEKERQLRKEGRSLRSLADEESRYWRYDQVIPFYKFTVDPPSSHTTGLPAPAQDPYRGFADLNTAPSPLLTFRFSDILGNRSADPTEGQGALNLTVGYTDPLIGIGEWPSISASFEVLPSGVPPLTSAILKVNLSLKAAALLPTPSQRGDVNLEATNRQKDRYGQVYYQLTHKGVEASLSTTLRWAPDTLNNKNQGQVIDIPLWRFAGAAYAHAHTTALLVPTTPIPDSTIAEIETSYNVRYAEIAEANKNQLVSTLFVAGTTVLQIPIYLPYVADRSLDFLYENRPAEWPDPVSGSALFSLDENGLLLLKTGTELTLPAAQVKSINTGTTTLTATLATLAVDNYVTAEMLAEQNADTIGLLAPDFIFTIAWEEANESILTVTVTVASEVLDSFTAVQNAFAAQGINLTIGQIAAQNATLAGMLAADKILVCSRYVVQEGDTPLVNSSGCTTSDLGNANAETADVFDDGSLVYFGSLDATVDGTLDALCSRYACPGEFILAANATVKVGENIAVPGSVSWPTDVTVLSQMRVPFTVFSTTDLFSDIVIRFCAYDANTGTATVKQAVEENSDIKGTLAAEVPITVAVEGASVTIVTGSDDSFDSALEKVQAQNTAATLDDLANAIANEAGVLALGALLLFPPVLLEAAATPDDMQNIYGIEPASFALANNATAQLINSGVPLRCSDASSTSVEVTTKTRETFNSLIVAFALEGITVDAGMIAIQNNTALLYTENAKALLPPAALTPTVSLGTEGPYMAPIFPLTSTLTFIRPNAVVNPEFRTTTEDGVVERADTIIAPLCVKSVGRDTDPGLTYLGFIKNLYSALPNLRAGTAKTQESNSDLWCVDFSATGITKADLKAGTVWKEEDYPRFFALAPLYSQLVTRNKVTIYPLGDNGVLCDTGNEINFQAVDVEPLAKRFLADFDRFLSVYYATALYDHDNGSLRSTLNSAITSKQGIITSISDGLDCVLDVDSDPNKEEGKTSARQSFKQQLGVNLLKGYEISVAIQYDLGVDSPWTRQLEALPASLYGDPSCNNANFAASIVAAKTPLEKASGAVTFFATVSDPAHVRALRGELNYAYSSIEFNISTQGMPEGYTSSDWLSFMPLLDEAAKPAPLLNTSPGAFAAPIPMRTFPMLPTIKSQTAAPTVLAPKNLNELSQWSFALTYAHQHAAQDTVYINAEFNLSVPRRVSAGVAEHRDLFTELARYAAVSDKLWTLLDPLLTDEPTSATVKNAAHTFASLAASIEKYWSDRLASDPQAATADDNYTAQKSYSFTARVEYKADKTIASFSLTKETEPGPSGLWPEVTAFNVAGIPVLLEAGIEDDGKVVYTVPAEKVIPATDSPTFRITWTGINVSSYQNARARISVERNQYLLEDSDPNKSLMIPTNPSFIFKTSQVTATGIVTPLLQWSERQEITANCDSLAQALTNALDILFPAAGRLSASTATFGVFYAYELAGDSTLPAQSLVGKTPVTLYPNRALQDLVAQEIQGAVDTWFNRVHPSSNGGEWAIGLTLYSALETAQRPLFSAELFYRINKVASVVE